MVPPNHASTRPERTTPLSPRAYCWVDTALGGTDHRNHVLRLEEFRPPPGAVDVYATYFQYTEALRDWWQTHRNARNNPTVGGYRGPCSAAFLPLDLDAPDPADALADVRRLLRYLQDAFDVPADAVRVNFSGAKGVHVELPAALFGGFEPGEHLPARFAELARYLATQSGCTTWDPTLYEHLRLYRLPNTRHSKTGRCAVPLSAAEVQTLSLDEIRALAVAPRTVERQPDNEWLPRPELAALWQRTTGIRTRTPGAENLGREPGAKLRPGQRHYYLKHAGRALQRLATTRDGILSALRALNTTEYDEPKPDSELVALADWVAEGEPLAEFHGLREDDPPGDAAEAPDAEGTQLEAELAKRDQYIETLIAERDAARKLAEERRHKLIAIERVCASQAISPTLKPVAIALTLAVERDPRLAAAKSEPVRIYRGQVQELAGLKSAATASQQLKHLDAADFLTLLRVPRTMEVFGRDGRPLRVKTQSLAVQLHPDEAVKKLELLARQPTRRNWGGKRSPRCPDHPHAALVRQLHCAVCDRVVEAGGAPQYQDAILVRVGGAAGGTAPACNPCTPPLYKECKPCIVVEEREAAGMAPDPQAAVAVRARAVALTAAERQAAIAELGYDDAPAPEYQDAILVRGSVNGHAAPDPQAAVPVGLGVLDLLDRAAAAGYPALAPGAGRVVAGAEAWQDFAWQATELDLAFATEALAPPPQERTA